MWDVRWTKTELGPSSPNSTISKYPSSIHTTYLHLPPEHTFKETGLRNSLHKGLYERACPNIAWDGVHTLGGSDFLGSNR